MVASCLLLIIGHHDQLVRYTSYTSVTMPQVVVISYQCLGQQIGSLLNFAVLIPKDGTNWLSQHIGNKLPLIIV